MSDRKGVWRYNKKSWWIPRGVAFAQESCGSGGFSGGFDIRQWKPAGDVKVGVDTEIHKSESLREIGLLPPAECGMRAGQRPVLLTISSAEPKQTYIDNAFGELRELQKMPKADYEQIRFAQPHS
jgi:hypothetical protein